MAVQSYVTVNRMVAGSSPARGASISVAYGPFPTRDTAQGEKSLRVVTTLRRFKRNNREGVPGLPFPESGTV